MNDNITHTDYKYKTGDISITCAMKGCMNKEIFFHSKDREL
jgi:hypothetical protein